MPFDLNTTTAYDYTNHNNDGTVSNAVWNGTGGYDGSGAYQFDGGNSSYISGFDTGYSPEATLSAWIKLDELGDAGNMIFGSSVAAAYTRINGVNKINLVYRNTSSSQKSCLSTYIISDYGWHHVAFTISQETQTITIYHNGEDVTDRNEAYYCNLTRGGPIQENSWATSIGKNYNGILSFNGTMDEMMIWNRSLSSSEVIDVYNNQSGRFFSTGTQVFYNQNLSYYADDDKANITAGVIAPSGSNLKVQINTGEITDISDGSVYDYSLTGDIQSATVTLYSTSDNHNFTTPVLIGNMTIITGKDAGSGVQSEEPVETSTIELTYDANGNLVSGDGVFRVYNSLNQLWQVYNGSDTGGTLLQEYTFHPTEERVLIKKEYSSGVLKDTTYYVSKEFVRTVNSSGTYDFTYVYHEGQLIAEKDADGNKKYYHPDHLGSTSLMTDSSGNLLENTFYTPYGVVLGGGSGRYQYEGKEFDSLTGQYDFHFRGYKSEWGKFVQPDSLLPNVYDPQQLNRYAFERNNPWKNTDETGHELTAFMAIMGLIGLFMGFSTIVFFNYGAPKITSTETQKSEFEKNPYGILYDADTSDVIDAVEKAGQNANQAQQATISAGSTQKTQTNLPPAPYREKQDEGEDEGLTALEKVKKNLNNIYNPLGSNSKNVASGDLGSTTGGNGGSTTGGERYCEMECDLHGKCTTTCTSV